MRAILPCLLALALALPISSPAQAAAKSYEYALDEQTEMTLEPNPDEPKKWTMELRQFGSATEGRVLLHFGDLEEIHAGVYESTAEDEGTTRTVQVKGKPGSAQPLEVTSHNLVLDTGGAATIAGVFKPLPPAERLQRAKDRWKAADAVLNTTYARVLAEVGKAGETKLRELQRKRIDMRDRRAEWDAHGTDNPKEKAVYWDTMLDYTVSNLELLNIYTGRGIPKGWSGRYRDIGGGSLELEETKKGLKFALSAVRKLSDANGEIAGIAKLDGDRAVYKEALSKKEQKDEDRQPAELVFTLTAGHRVKVEEKNTAYFGGVGVYFSGEYFKQGALKKPLEIAE